MSLVRLLPAWFHAVADYAVGGLLIIVALAVGGSTGAVATGVVVGAVVLLVSMLTRYPLGVVRVLPFTVHSAGDYLAAALLVIAPFTLNFSDGDGGLSAFYVVAGIAVLAVSLITNYQYSPRRSMGTQPTTALDAEPFPRGPTHVVGPRGALRGSEDQRVSGRKSAARRSGSFTVTVRPGWRSGPAGASPFTGSRNLTHTPPAVVLPNVRPRSTSERRGPMARYQRYGPLTSTPLMLERSVSHTHGPNRATNLSSETVTNAVRGTTPIAIRTGRNPGSNSNSNRSVVMPQPPGDEPVLAS
jgi:hypothetical protein